MTYLLLSICWESDKQKTFNFELIQNTKKNLCRWNILYAEILELSNALYYII